MAKAEAAAGVSGRDVRRKGRGNGSATVRGISFQESVGTRFAAWLLTARPIDHRLALGEARVQSLGAEADAPVDDLVVATSDGGYVAVQAKTGLPLSDMPDSRFRETMRQFVDHWLTCVDGQGEPGWRRPLDPMRDRLVIAVDPTTPLTVRHDLPAALQFLREPGSAALAAKGQRALRVFRSCVEQAWSDATGESPDPGFAAALAQVVEVFEVDPADRDGIEVILELGLAEGADGSSVLNALEGVVADVMKEGGNVDTVALRRRLMSKGVVLTPARLIARDVSALVAHSAATAEQLIRHERMSLAAGAVVSIQRECQAAIEEAARAGSLLIVGEAGIGKSGVLNALARNLRERGGDVVQLAVDGHSVESLEGLSRDVGLEHDLIEVLRGWDGSESGWLVIDGLDATRGGTTESVFRTLIRRTLDLGGRWRVIASIRSFDLQMGLELRTLFEGAVPVAELAEARFGDVRHVSVPGWAEAEFAQLLGRAPALRRALRSAPQDLVELARVPFNTNLIGDLLGHGVEAVRLEEVSSQTQLLRLYWEQRIGGYGTPARTCLFKTVEAMLAARALRAAKHNVEFAQQEVFDDLSSVGVLIGVPDDAWVQFRHHVLFDFATARRLLTSDPIGANPDLRKENAHGLLLAPAIRFVLQEQWEIQASRESFWTVMEPLLTDETVDPVIGIAAARMAAELPTGREDLAPLVERIASGSDGAAHVLQRVAGALVIAMEDELGRPMEPWVGMLVDLAPHVGQVANVYRFMLFKIVERAEDHGLRSQIGIAARALLGYALSAGEEGAPLARPAIGFVTTTYDTDPSASRQLLRDVFNATRFEQYGAEEIPAVCEGAKAVMASDPEFVAEIYRMTYGRDITDDRETSLSSSRILALRSTARHDYGMARYQLEELFGEFLVAHPRQAARAIEDAVAGYLASEEPIPETAEVYEFMAEGHEVRLREDVSHIWAYDPEDSYGGGAPALVVTLLETLKSCDEDVAIEIAEGLIGEASLGVLWSRVFAAAAERGGRLLQYVAPYALKGPFLTAFETRKDAIDVVAIGYENVPLADREAFERGAFALEFARFADRAVEARQACLETLFGAIGHDRLATDEARRMVSDEDGRAGDGSPNERPFRVVGGWRELDDAGDNGATDEPDSESDRARAAIRAAETALVPATDEGQGLSGSFDEICGLLESVERRIRAEGVDDELVREGEGVIGKGCLAICDAKLVPEAGDDEATERYARLLRVACVSRWPVVEADTEARYEDSPMWGSPAPRVEAAEATLRTLRARPDLLDALSADLDRLLADPHPAVRMHAVVKLGSTRLADPTVFCERLAERVRSEGNVAVLRYLSETVLQWAISVDTTLAERLVLDLLEKSTGDTATVQRLRSSLATNLTLLAVRHQRREAHAVIEAWIGDCAMHHEELGQVLRSMREGYTLGMRQGEADRDGLRQRCLELASRIAEAAAADFTARMARLEGSDAEAALARQSARLLDWVCDEIRASVVEDRVGSGGQPDSGLASFVPEASAMLMTLADAGTPRTVYTLLEVLEYLLALDPAKVLDIAMHAILGGGRRSGFQFEYMGADRVVGIVARVLADHRQIFDVEERRQTLVRCLELFASAGWPSAMRLLYRLPELFR